MRSRPSVFLAAVLLACAGAASAERPTSIDKVNGSIRTDEGAEYRSLDTVNGSIVLAARATAESIETVNGSITLRENSRGGEVETVNGAIRMDRGALSKGTIETVNGTLNLEGAEVGGNLNTVNGDINVLDGSRVAGGIKIEKPTGSWFNWGGNQRTPTVVIGANSEVAGPMVFEREVELFVHESARIGSVSGAEVKRFSGAKP